MIIKTSALIILLLLLNPFTARAGDLLQYNFIEDTGLGDRTSSIAGTPAPVGSEKLRAAQKLLWASKNEEAFKLLSENLETAPDKDQKGLTLFSLGVVSYKMGKDQDAQNYLGQAMALGTRINDYIDYFLGLSYKRTGQMPKARAEFLKVLDSKAPAITQQEARLQLGDVAFTEKNYRGALQQYRLLQKKFKNTESYPTVLVQLLRSERRLGGRNAGCKWAKELYAKYPSAPEIKDWTADLVHNKIDGQILGCSASQKELQSRIRRLQWSGEAERALTELKSMQGRLGGEGQYSMDALIANHFINEGRTDEALRLLLSHYDEQNGRPGYLLLLAKAASRAGDFQAAVGAFYRAYQMAPRAKDSRNALFQAAFMSYQFQDYDGASHKFEQFVKTFASSGLVRDCQWHLAWIRYLKGDYSGAYSYFAKLANVKMTSIRRRGRRRIRVVVDPNHQERVKYWMAMSLLKMNRPGEAIPLFLQLARDPSIGYYSVLSYYRLTTIPASSLKGDINLAKKAALEGAGQMSEEELLTAAVKAQDEEAVAAEADSEASLAASSGDAAPELVDGEAQASAQDDAGTGDEDVTGDTAPSLDTADVNFNAPFLSKRFDRARDLVTAGLDEFARRELMEIERHTRNSNDRRTLMQEYQLVQNFYRASYIGETEFGVQRIRGGIQGARQLWEYTYPRAYDQAVTTNAKNFSVPEELIWGIMRAESHYRRDAQSPVGALGLMQLMPFTAQNVAGLLGQKEFDPHQLLDPESNIHYGTRYLQRLLERLGGSLPLVAAGYNAGPHRVASWVRGFGVLDMDEFIEHIPFVETRNYVKRVVRNVQIYSLLYSGQGRNLKWLVKPVGVTLDEKTALNENW